MPGTIQNEYKTAFTEVPLFMMIVNKDRKVLKVNDAVLQFTGEKEETVLGLRGGEALKCVHYKSDPKGCGFSSACNTCAVRNTVLNTFETRRSHHKVEATISFFNDMKNERSLLVSTAIIEEKDDKVIVFLEDITKQKAAERALVEEKEKLREALEKVRLLSGLLPICSSCKKIRDDKGYWNELETYMHKHSDMTFSHSLCPDCSDDLYGQEDWYIELNKNKKLKK